MKIIEANEVFKKLTMDIGGLLNGKCNRRSNASEITLFDALGLAIEDVAAAKYMISLEE